MRLYRMIAFVFIVIIMSCADKTDNNIPSMPGKNSSRSEYIKIMTEYNNEEDFIKADSVLSMYRERFGNYLGIENLASMIYSNMAGYLIVNQQYDSAFVYLKRADSIYGQNKRALKLLSKVYAMSGIYDSAEISINRALDIDTLDAEAYLIKGNIAFLQGRGMDAQKAYTYALHIDTSYDEAYLNLGILYYETQNYAYSLRMFKEAVKYDSLCIAAYDYIISTYANAGIPDSSLRYAEIFERKKGQFMEDSIQ